MILADERIAFGIGCFTFEVKDQFPQVTPDEYSRRVVDALQSIPSVDNIDMSIPADDWTNCNDDTSTKRRDPWVSRQFEPCPSIGWLSFDIRIPYRFQTEIIGKHRPKTSDDLYTVATYFTFHSPVTFVISHSDDEDRPADTVRFVREFLGAEFVRMGTSMGGVTFRFLGPSPFHAECYIAPAIGIGTESVDGYNVHRDPSKGYVEYSFFYDQSRFPDAQTAMEDISYRLRDELGLFYAISRVKQERLISWHEVSDTLETLVNIYERKGFRAFALRVFRLGSALRRLLIDVITVESITKAAYLEVSRDVRSVYESNYFPVFKGEVENSIADLAESPDSSYRSLVSLIDSQRIREIEMLVLLGSSLLGGIAGGLLTLLATGGNT